MANWMSLLHEEMLEVNVDEANGLSLSTACLDLGWSSARKVHVADEMEPSKPSAGGDEAFISLLLHVQGSS